MSLHPWNNRHINVIFGATRIRTSNTRSIYSNSISHSAKNPSRVSSLCRQFDHGTTFTSRQTDTHHHGDAPHNGGHVMSVIPSRPEFTLTYSVSSSDHVQAASTGGRAADDSEGSLGEQRAYFRDANGEGGRRGGEVRKWPVTGVGTTVILYAVYLETAYSTRLRVLRLRSLRSSPSPCVRHPAHCQLIWPPVLR